jgi:hypothetical protein
MNFKITYLFESTIWKHSSSSAWYFVTLPNDLSLEIRELFGKEEEGWGRLKVRAQTGRSEWQTSIWWDSKKGAYLLPLKAAIRKKEHLEENELTAIKIWV